MDVVPTPEIKMPRGWKNVSLPPQIEALPKEPKRGFPIPYVAEWSHDGDYDLEIRNGYAVMTCSCKIGVGVPDLGNQCPVRQRQCMSLTICGACGETITEGTYYFLGGSSLKYFVEPALHEECALYSIQVCPGITRREHMSVVECEEYKLYDRFEVPEIEGHPLSNTIEYVEEDELPFYVMIGFPMAMTMKAAVPREGRKFTAAEWLESRRG
jgi:hypothetical protein